MSKINNNTQEEKAILVHEGVSSMNPVKMDSQPTQSKSVQAQELVDIIRTMMDTKYKHEPTTN